MIFLSRFARKQYCKNTSKISIKTQTRKIQACKNTSKKLKSHNFSTDRLPSHHSFWLFSTASVRLSPHFGTSSDASFSVILHCFDEFVLPSMPSTTPRSTLSAFLFVFSGRFWSLSSSKFALYLRKAPITLPLFRYLPFTALPVAKLPYGGCFLLNFGTNSVLLLFEVWQGIPILFRLVCARC